MEQLINRVLWYVNRVIALLVVLLLIAAWWYAWRPLPQTSGTVQAFLRRRVEVAKVHGLFSLARYSLRH